MTKSLKSNDKSTDTELSYYQNFIALLGRLQQVRIQSSGKIRIQGLVRTFMLGVNSFFPCMSVRVYYGGWYYQHFESQKSLSFPPLSIESKTLGGSVYKRKKVFYYLRGKQQKQFSQEIDLYLENGISYLHISPILDVNQDAQGIIEITGENDNIPSYQKELVEMCILQLGNLLEGSGVTTKKEPSSVKRSPAPVLLKRLKQYEDERKEVVEREKLFYSLIRYFRDTVRLVEAWRNLQSLTPENEIGQYDFSRHSELYFNKTYKFSELLLYSYKIRHNDLPPQLNEFDLIELIHESIAEFTRHHQKFSLNLRTQFSKKGVKAIVDRALFRTAITYALEHLFIKSSNLSHNTCLVVKAKNLKNSASITLEIEQDPLVKKLQFHDFDFVNYMGLPLDEYGLEDIFLPFVIMAIMNQGGTINAKTGEQMTKIDIDIPKGFLTAQEN